MPTRVGIHGDRVYVTNAEGRGSSPNPRHALMALGEPPIVHPGSVATFIMPDRAEVLRQTGNLFVYDGFVPYMSETRKPRPMEHVVLIVKGNQTFDQVFGDIGEPAAGVPSLARFGMHGSASGGKNQFSLQDAPITPNQHAIARRWTLSDNFYVDGDSAQESEIFFQRRVPDLASEIAIRGGLDPLDPDSPGSESDQHRADAFIHEMEERYIHGGEKLPGLIVLRLPGDSPRAPNPEAGYPYPASYIVDNDFATGKVLAWLSRSPWWRNMTVFITEHDTDTSQSETGASLDHLNSRRTFLIAAGPWIRKNYVSHVNSDVNGLFRTIGESLGTMPQNVTEATAASLRDIFTSEPDFTPFDAVEPERRIFDPAQH